MEQITCQDCGTTWERKPKPGRKPKRCAECAGRNTKAYRAYASRPQAKPRDCVDCGREMTTLEKRRRGPNGEKCADCAPLHAPRLRPRADDGSQKSRVTCRTCGVKLTGKQRFECATCAKPPTIPKRPCSVCGTMIQPLTKRQHLCSANGGQLHSDCSIKWFRHKESGTPLDHTNFPPFTCANCGKHCEPGINCGKNARKYCGTRCKQTALRPAAPGIVPCVDCGSDCKRRKNKKANRCSMCDAAYREARMPSGGRRGYRRWTAGPCLECGQQFVGRWHSKWPARYCSDECAAKEQQRRKHKNRRTRTDKQRAEMYGVEYQPISRRRVFERDEWLCYICGEPTTKTYDHADPWSPTLDHIVPISQGGPHTYDNVALAHAYCNAIKCDGEDADVWGLSDAVMASGVA